MEPGLGEVSTADLQNELSKREGIETHSVNPHESYSIMIGETILSGTGPVLISVNRD